MGDAAHADPGCGHGDGAERGGWVVSAPITCNLRRLGLRPSTPPLTRARLTRSIGGRLGRLRGVAALGAERGCGQPGAVVAAGEAFADFRAAAGEGVETPSEDGGEGNDQKAEPEGDCQGVRATIASRAERHFHLESMRLKYEARNPVDFMGFVEIKEPRSTFAHRCDDPG